MPARVTVTLRDPVADRPGERFESTSQPLRSPSGASQGDAQTIWRRKARGFGGLDFGMVDTSVVTLIQRFGSTLNLSVHPHKFNQPTLMSLLCGQTFTACSWSHFARLSIAVSSHTSGPSFTSRLFRKRTL